MTMISSNLQCVHARIAAACKAAGRDVKEVTLLAVSKTFGADAVQEAIAAGQTAFGENYIQEAVEKIRLVRQWEDACLRLASSRHSSGVIRPDERPANAEPGWPNRGSACAVAPAEALHCGASSPQAGPLSRPAQWHCIGPIQSNKTRLVAENFDWAHTVDRLKIAQRLSEQRPAHLPPLQVCVQVNIDGGPTKAGVLPEEAMALAHAVAGLPRLALRGLMCIPEPAHDFVADCTVLTRARALFDHILSENRRLAAFGAAPGPAAAITSALRQGPAPPLFTCFDTLSMGMTGDLEAAIHAGSTMVRVGTAIFGGRAKAAAPQG